MMSEEQISPPSPSIPSNPQPPPQNETISSSPAPNENATAPNDMPTTRSKRPTRACTIRAAARMQLAIERKPKPKPKPKAKPKKEQQQQGESSETSSSSLLPRSQQQQCSKVVTPLVGPPEPSQLPRWSLRSMWELASALNFLHVFRHLLNIQVEFSAEEFETALITPNDTLSDIHMPLLKAIPPVTRMALTRNTWITVLCRKLRDWWHWVAEGELPIVASHGAEVEVYKSLDPGMRVVILKALCDIRVEQEDIRGYIDSSLKQGVQLSAFRKERIGGDSHGISYWYEDDSIIGHRLYREIRKAEAKEMKKGKTKGSKVLPNISYQWEAVATNLDEFQVVSDKLFSSKNRTEVSVGRKLKNDMLPEIEKIHKRKERLLKKQHREALLLDNFLNVDGLAAGGRSLRDRKPVTYTFDDFDRSISEAIKITKTKQPSPEPDIKREVPARGEISTNGKLSGPSDYSQPANFSAPSPSSLDCDNFEEDHDSELFDRRSRRRKRPQRFSEKEYIEDISENDVHSETDDDIVGEAVYDEEYLRTRKQRKKASSSSELEGDDDYHWDDDNGEEEEEEEDSLSWSEDSDEPRKIRKTSGRTRRVTKLRPVDELQSGLRRSKRATRNRINYRQYELSDSGTEAEAQKAGKTDSVEGDSDSDASERESENEEYSVESEDYDQNGIQEMKADETTETHPEKIEDQKNQPAEKVNSPGQGEVKGVQERRFLDLNELAPGSGFDDGPNTITKDEDTDNL